MKTIFTLFAILLAIAITNAQDNNSTIVPDSTSPANNAGNSSSTPMPNTSHETSSPGTAAVTTEAATTAAPTPPPEPANGTWMVNDTGKVCIIVQMGVRFTFNYTTTENKTALYQVDMPVNTTKATGACGTNTSNSQTISLAFFSDWSLTMEFKKSSDGKEYSVHTVTLIYDETSFPKVKDPKTGVNVQLANQTLFKTNVDNSYLCVKDSSVNMTDQVSFATADLHVEAFRESSDVTFSKAVECSADSETSNIVPIAVGAALAALVLIVLIAYLISRKKSKSGYESV